MGRLRASGVGRVLVLAACGCGPASSTNLEDAGSLDGGDGGGPIALAPGEAVELPVSGGAAGARLAAPRGDERFLVILASMALEQTQQSFTYTATAGAAPASPGAAAALAGCSLDDADWRDRALPDEKPPSGAAPEVGTERSLLINGKTFQARVIAVGTSAVVWADITPAHPANLDIAVVNDFLADFEHLILPRDRTIFGIESDLDGDGHIALVFTPLTKTTAVAFFTGCDLKRLPGCPAGNQGEYLYLTPPAAIDPPYNTPAAIKEILAHELSHLIHFNRKVLRNSLSSWDDSSYLIEGVGALAQDTSGFQAGNLYVTEAGLDGIDQLSLADTLVDGTQYDLSRDGVLRGGSYLFVRWLFDRAGGDHANGDGTLGSRGGPAMLRALLDAADPVADSMSPIAHLPAAEAGLDFFTTLALSNRDHAGGIAPRNPCFAYLPTALDPVTARQRGADVFATFHGMSMKGPATQALAEADGELLGGGVEYLELAATAGGAGEVAFTVQAEVPAAPRVRVARIF